MLMWIVEHPAAVTMIAVVLILVVFAVLMFMFESVDYGDLDENARTKHLHKDNRPTKEKANG